MKQNQKSKANSRQDKSKANGRQDKSKANSRQDKSEANGRQEKNKKTCEKLKAEREEHMKHTEDLHSQHQVNEEYIEKPRTGGIAQVHRGREAQSGD